MAPTNDGLRGDTPVGAMEMAHGMGRVACRRMDFLRGFCADRSLQNDLAAGIGIAGPV